VNPKTMNEDIWTIKKLLDWTQGYLQKKSFISARLDAELLLAFVLKLKRIQLYLQFDRPLTASELADFKALLTRRAQYEPIAYITGQKEFFSRDFFVSRDVLIPRPDSEVLIEHALKNLDATGKDHLHGFEIGAGSGCLGITLLCENPKLHMTAIEVSQEAIAVCQKNARTHGVSERLHVIHADFLKNDSSWQHQFKNKTFDLVLANPPYIDDLVWETLARDVRDHEPKLALKGGKSGLDFYPEIAAFGQKYLLPSGFVIVEIGDEQGQAVQELFTKQNFKQVFLKQDYAGLDRVVIAKMNS